jgi:predicted ribosomally synthesized peptide with nif11-like leader
MSVENVKKYMKLYVENEEVRKKAEEIGLKDADGQIAHAKSLGLEFSKEDMAALVKEAGIEGKNELNEEDLEKVAGGYMTFDNSQFEQMMRTTTGITKSITDPLTSLAQKTG